MTYATVEQANDYHAARLSAEAWFALSSAKHLPALQSATDALDAYAAAHGGWKDFNPEAIPAAIQAACCEVALTLTDPALQERIKAQQQGVTSTSIGSASESYTGNARAEAVLISPTLALRLKPYLKQAGGSVHIL